MEEQNYLPPAQSRRSYWKAAGIFVGVIILVFAAWLLWQSYKLYKMQKAGYELAERIEREQAELQSRRVADTYGGKTPQETLRMYVDAVEEGDYELASKYFVIEKQEEWRDRLISISQSDKVENLLSPLRQAMQSSGRHSDDKSEFFIDEPVGVDFFLYPSGIWKIVEI